MYCSIVNARMYEVEREGERKGWTRGEGREGDGQEGRGEKGMDRRGGERMGWTGGQGREVDGQEGKRKKGMDRRGGERSGWTGGEEKERDGQEGRRENHEECMITIKHLYGFPKVRMHIGWWSKLICPKLHNSDNSTFLNLLQG